MKLVIEINDYVKDGTLHWCFMPSVQPYDKTGIPVHDKSRQMQKYTRLAELAEALEAATESFYQKATTVAPITSISDASDPLT